MCYKVMIVLVTYNRRKCLSTLLKALKNQTIKPWGILVVDNNSTDDTNAFLQSIGFTDSDIYNVIHMKVQNGIKQFYYRNTENVGGSGGFAKAVDIAKEYDTDYTWIMDDDVEPYPTCLEIMLNYMSDAVKASIPNRSDEDFQDHACRNIDMRSLHKFRISLRKEFYELPFCETTYEVKDMAFEGPLISTDIIRKVGLPNAGYFIEYDDSDYAQRIMAYTPILFVTNAHMHRQLARQAETNKKTDRKYCWRNYYSIRNNILFNHKYAETWRARHLSTGLLWIYHVLRSLYYGKPKNIKIINMAVKDGMSDVYGRKVKPGEL